MSFDLERVELKKKVNQLQKAIRKTKDEYSISLSVKQLNEKDLKIKELNAKLTDQNKLQSKLKHEV